MKMTVIAGESSGDQLGGDLVAALRQSGAAVELIGVGGPSLAGQGLVSLFDYSELSIMGLTAVLARLPNLIRRINETARAIIAERPDCLVLIDSPDFTHRVARKVRAALPDLPIVNYVCPSVWAWKEYRAAQMRAYVDLVLAVLPFEPAVMARLGGPKTVYVGHRLATSPEVLAARQAGVARWQAGPPAEPVILLLPGSRRSEVSRLLPDFLVTAERLADRMPCRFLLPAVEHLKHDIAARVAASGLPVQIIDGKDRWTAFGQADAALAASGTVILELALCGVPVVSTYRTDWLVRLMLSRIRIWSAAIPNLVLDEPVIPEFFNEMVRPDLLARYLEGLARHSPRRAMMIGSFGRLAEEMATPEPAGQRAAAEILTLLDKTRA